MVFDLHTLCVFCLTLDAVNIAALVLTAWCVKTSPKRLLARVPELLRSELRGLVIPTAAIAVSTLGLALIGHTHLKAVLEAEARAAVLAPSGSSSSATRDRDDEPAASRKLPTKRWDVSVDDDDASIGPKDARVTLVEFGDFQCGYCKKLEGALSAVRRNFSDRVRLVFKHFPMDPRCNRIVHNQKHEYSCDAAVSAECARRQGKFWPLHDLLYENQTRLKPGEIERLATTIGLDLQTFTTCTKDPSALEAVLHDTDEGGRLNVSGTPRTFINGRLFAGALSEELLTFVIRVELGEITGTEAETYTGRVEP
jgi:protein-disulfide isomerase